MLEKKRWPDKALTAALVKSIKEPGKYYDGQGMFLRVEPNLSKRWVQRIAVHGRQREIGLGSAALVTLAEARTRALDNRKLARAGGDPLQAKRDAEAVLTFAEAAKVVHEANKPTWRNVKHAAQFLSTLETYVFPHFGATRISDVTTGDVLMALSPIWTEKAETARRVRQRIGTVMKWAMAKGWRKDNPADAIDQALPKTSRVQEHRKALPYTSIATCLDVVRQSGAGAATKLALELLVLTACRSGEVRGALWSEIDMEKAEWNIPASRMKAKVAHRIPLTKQALAVLKSARALGDGAGLVFPGTKAGKALSDATLSKLVKELGFEADVHGFRTSFRTWAQEQSNMPREVVEKALAHSIKDRAEAAYARSDLFEKRRKLMESWAGYLAVKRGDVVRSG